MDKIYLICGKAGSGKDTCAKVLKHEYEALGKRVIVISFADYVRTIMSKSFGINDFKTPSGRTAIQHFATDIVRENDPTFGPA